MVSKYKIVMETLLQIKMASVLFYTGILESCKECRIFAGHVERNNARSN